MLLTMDTLSQKSHPQVHLYFILPLFALFLYNLLFVFSSVCIFFLSLSFSLLFMSTIVNSHAGTASPFAGSGQPGSSDGVGASASFHHPYEIAIDQQTGNLFVSDHNNHSIRKITPQGMCINISLSILPALTTTKRRGINTCWVAVRLRRWDR